jgi:hypothetical protein
MTDHDRIDPATLAKVAQQAEAERLAALRAGAPQAPRPLGGPARQNLLGRATPARSSCPMDSAERTRSTWQALARLVFAFALIVGFFGLLNAVF